jgi:hypothetical protein
VRVALRVEATYRDGKSSAEQGAAARSGRVIATIRRAEMDPATPTATAPRTALSHWQAANRHVTPRPTDVRAGRARPGSSCWPKYHRYAPQATGSAQLTDSFVPSTGDESEAAVVGPLSRPLKSTV